MIHVGEMIYIIQRLLQTSDKRTEPVFQLTPTFFIWSFWSDNVAPCRFFFSWLDGPLAADTQQPAE